MPSPVGGEAVVTNDWYIKRKSEKMILLMFNPCKFYSVHHQANFIYAPYFFLFEFYGPSRLFCKKKKTSKIMQATVIKQYGEGGLKMINIMAFIEALKSTWIRRQIITDNKWQMFIKKYIQIEKLTGCNIKYIEEMITHLANKFWKDVLLSLIKIHKKWLLLRQTS